MQASTVQKRLDSLPFISEVGKRVNGLMRLLASRTLMEASVNKTRRNQGSATPGIDGETLDGLTMERINGWVRTLAGGSHRAKPVKRVFIPKANGQLRPLGIPTYADRMVQNGQREILQRIYEPVFSRNSHGFRPGRSCHTALAQVQKWWCGTKWFVEVDIKGFFDNIDHDVLLNLLRKRIDDEAFIATIQAQLQAGVMEKPAVGNRSGKKAGRWKHQPTYSGTPQGGIVSPILANIYLHELDEFMEAEIQAFHRGKTRRPDPEYRRVRSRVNNLRVKLRRRDAAGEGGPEREKLVAEFREQGKAMRSMDAVDHMDPNYRRLTYARYADDFIIGVIGSKADAVAVLEKVRAFLGDTLHLDVSEDKTGIVKATDGARFLGYDVKTVSGTRVMRVRRGECEYLKRNSAERVALVAPHDKLRGFCKKHGYGDYAKAQGRQRGELIRSSDYEIVSIYNAEMRGFANYYRLDTWIKGRVGKLAWVASQSLFRTLANKHKTSSGKMTARLRQPGGRHVVRHAGRSGKTSEITVWLPKDLKHLGIASWDAGVDRPPLGAAMAFGRNDVTVRMQAGECENVLCTSPPGTPIQVHHVRALADVGQSSCVEWLTSARIRKTRYLCVHCHPRVRTISKRKGVKYAKGEPDAVKAASPVPGEGASRPDGD